MLRGLRRKPRRSVRGFIGAWPEGRAYTGCTFWFYPRPLRQSGKQGTTRIVKPVHRRKPRSFLNLGQYRRGCPLSTSGSASRPVHSRRHPPVLNHEPRARRLPLAIVLPCSLFTNRRPVLLTSKEVLITIIRTRVLGHVGLRWVVPVPGIPALPLTRHCQVVRGLCPMTVSRQRTCQLRLSGGQKH